MVLTFLLVVQAIVAAILVGVILMQQSEGGGLGMGGSPTGLMSARGAADFLTRATTILASVFIALSILHSVLAARTSSAAPIDTSLARKTVTAATLPAPTAPAPNAPAGVDPLAIPTPGAIAPTVPAPKPLAQSAPSTTAKGERARIKPAAAVPAPTPTNSN